MKSNFAWKVFETTGQPEQYLAYKRRSARRISSDEDKNGEPAEKAEPVD